MITKAFSLPLGSKAALHQRLVDISAATFPPHRKSIHHKVWAPFEVSSYNVQRHLHRRSPASSRKIPRSSPSGTRLRRKNASDEFSFTFSCHVASRIRSIASSPTT